MRDSQICPCCGAPLIADGNVRVDEDAGLVVGQGRVASLARAEFDLFLALWSARPRMLTKEQLLKATSGLGYDDREIKIVDVFVCKARKKLAAVGVEIETVWGQGYRIVGPWRGPDAGVASAPSTLQEAEALG